MNHAGPPNTDEWRAVLYSIESQFGASERRISAMEDQQSASRKRVQELTDAVLRLEQELSATHTKLVAAERTLVKVGAYLESQTREFNNLANKVSAQQSNFIETTARLSEQLVRFKAEQDARINLLATAESVSALNQVVTRVTSKIPVMVVIPDGDRYGAWSELIARDFAQLFPLAEFRFACTSDLRGAEDKGCLMLFCFSMATPRWQPDPILVAAAQHVRHAVFMAIRSIDNTFSLPSRIDGLDDKFRSGIFLSSDRERRIALQLLLTPYSATTSPRLHMCAQNSILASQLNDLIRLTSIK